MTPELSCPTRLSSVMKAVLTVFILLLSTLTFAQTESATLSGTVMDRTGAVVPGTQVQATNSDTNVTATTLTNRDGIYVIPSLKPGRYRMTVTKQGFKQVVVTDVILNVQDTISRNFNLDPGAVSESVTVTANAAQVNTTDATVSTVVDRQFVENLPLNGRSFNTLLQLTPGVVIPPSRGASVSPGQFSISGQRVDANNFEVDGVSANFGVASTVSPGNSGLGQTQAFSVFGGTSSLVSVDALQEFRIETSSFAPEFGRSPGGQVLLSTRSGTNDFHGGIFEYFRNDVMDANDWFNNAATPPIRKPPERHNDFGGFLGGPLVRDRTFFFFSYEGARLRTPSSAVTVVPSAASRASAPASLAPFLNAYPQPNGAISPAGDTAVFTGSYSNQGTLDAASIRLDHVINSRLSLFGRYNEAPSQFIRRLSPLSTISKNDVGTRTVTAGLNMALTSSLSNSVRVNYSQQNASFSEDLDTFGGAVPLDAKLLLGSLPSADSAFLFGILGTDGYYSIGPNARNKSTQLNFVDGLAMMVGKHLIKLGGDYRLGYLNNRSVQEQLFFVAPPVQTFISSGAALLLSASTVVPGKIRTQALSLYGQDSWNVTPRLTVTYGLRWELSPTPSPLDTTSLSAWTNVDDPSAIALAPAGTPLWSTTYTNFAPRVGVAYAVTENRDLVLRAGWGVYYDLGLGVYSDLMSAFPNLGSAVSFGVPLPLTDATPYLPVLSSQPPYPRVQGFRPDLKLPRSYQWNVAVEKTLWNVNVISATYVGQSGTRLLRRDAFNQPNANFSSVLELTGNGGTSDYHALEVQFRRPLAARVQALVNYVWSHSIDNGSSDAVDLVSNAVFSGQNDRGSSDFDIRHSLSAAVSCSIPGVSGPKPLALLTKDWSIDSIIVARTGFPFNAAVLNVVTGNTRGQRPDVVAGQPYWIQDPVVAGGKKLNPAAFSIPPTTRQGTEGRNDITGFSFTQIDLSIRRKFPITDRVSVLLRGDAFNVLNHPNFANPAALVGGSDIYLESRQMLNQGLGGLNPLFQQGGPRSLQVSLKLTF